MDKLTNYQLEIINRRYLNDKTEKLQDIATERNCSRQAVCEIEKKAIRKIGEGLKSQTHTNYCKQVTKASMKQIKQDGFIDNSLLDHDVKICLILDKRFRKNVHNKWTLRK